MLLAFVALLAVHWIADFVCQTHWQASNKSKNIEALCRHVSVYSAVLAVGAVLLFGFTMATFWFVVANNFAHLATDYVTSRWSSRHFGAAMTDAFAQRSAIQNYGENADHWLLHHPEVNPGRHFHKFFVVIGFDQLIHQVTLAATLYFVIGSF